MSLLGTRLPIVAAPMAGGASSPALVRAATAAGAFAFLPGGYKSAAALSREIAELKAADLTFGVNLFRAEPTEITAADYDAYARALQPEADPYGMDLSAIERRSDDDGWDAKLAALLADPVAWVSTTFGVATAAEIAALHAVGTRVAVTVTRALEASWIDSRLDVDLLVVQGAWAGGHRASFLPEGELPAGQLAQSTAELVGYVTAQTRLPVIAGGGVDGAGPVRDILAAGAQAVAVGTLLLRSDESGASQTHKDALADPRFEETVFTHAFTGRRARALRNGFIDRHQAQAPLGYPAVHHLTGGLRKAAAAAGNPDQVHLWAGTGFRSAQTGPVGRILRELAA